MKPLFHVRELITQTKYFFKYSLNNTGLWVKIQVPYMAQTML